MTREEAIRELRIQFVGEYDRQREAKDIAIKVLEQQPSERTEEHTEMHACDYIRRSDIGLTNLEILMCNGDYKEALKMLLDKIKNAPSVTPQPKEEPQQKTGHWTHDGSNWTNRWICSECGYKLYDEQSNYCPNCGSYNGGTK